MARSLPENNLKERHLRIMATLVYIGAPFILRQLVGLIFVHGQLDTTPTLDGCEFFAGEHELTKAQWAMDKALEFSCLCVSEPG